MALGNPFWSFIFGHLFAGLCFFFLLVLGQSLQWECRWRLLVVSRMVEGVRGCSYNGDIDRFVVFLSVRKIPFRSALFFSRARAHGKSHGCLFRIIFLLVLAVPSTRFGHGLPCLGKKFYVQKAIPCVGVLLAFAGCEPNGGGCSRLFLQQ